MSSRNCASDSNRHSAIRLLILIAWFSLVVAETPAYAEDEAAPLTLKACYELALKRSETIAIQQELLKETEGRFLQALGTILPTASFVSTDKRQDGSGGSAFTLRDIPERKFTFSQPLFSGFKEFAAMAGSRAERRQHTHEKTRAEHLLLVDVADAFYLLLQQRQELAALETTRNALVERIDDLQQRERLGRSRSSEVVSAQARLRRVEADLERVRGLKITARHLLEFLTGREPIEELREEDLASPNLEPETSYLAKAELRPDVRATEEAWRVARQTATIAKAKFWPTVSTEGNYYTKRVGVAQDVDWDVLLKVDVPLFHGGQNVGSVREAASRARQAQLRFEQTKRSAILDIRDAYATLQSAMDRTIALEKALAAAEDNYRLQVEDYRLNLVNNLDVLQALQELEDARREAIGARYEMKRLYWQLRVATGETL